MVLNRGIIDEIVDKKDALQGRELSITVSKKHLVFGNDVGGDFGEFSDQICFGAGCFWGVEKKFWLIPGVISTSVGYAGGHTNNPTYEEVCSGKTAHTEVVLVTFNSRIASLETIIKVFWEMHNPTQGFRQGNDVGTQYRSAIYFINDRHESIVNRSKLSYQKCLNRAGKGLITTEIKKLDKFYFAEDYHQQYLVKNPFGYCALMGTGCEYVD